jgi:hypothetical protein
MHSTLYPHHPPWGFTIYTMKPPLFSCLFILQFLSSSSISSSGSSSNYQDYDDTKRSTCVEAMNTWFLQNSALEQAGDTFALSMNISLTRHDDEVVGQHDASIFTQTFPPPGHVITNQYEATCRDAGGFWNVFTGILDCVGYGEFNQDTVSIMVIHNQATCFPPTGCQDYTTVTWVVDTSRVFQDDCHVRGGNSEVLVDLKNEDNDETPSSTSLAYSSRSESLQQGRDRRGAILIGLGVLIGVVIVLAFIATNKIWKGKMKGCNGGMSSILPSYELANMNGFQEVHDEDDIPTMD